jgi:hypothetical protein
MEKKKPSWDPSKYKLVVKFFRETGTTRNKRKNAHQYPVGLRHFKNTPLWKCYKLVNDNWAGQVAWAAIYDQKAKRGNTVARYTAENGWNNIL